LTLEVLRQKKREFKPCQKSWKTELVIEETNGKKPLVNFDIRILLNAILVSIRSFATYF